MTWKRIQKTLKEDEKEISPRPHLIFRPLIETPLKKVKVMMVANEPSAMAVNDGLAYSYPKNLSQGFDDSLPVKTQNLMIELYNDTEIMPKTANLCAWARKGVLLWNSTLTVKKCFPFSHMTVGWEMLTKEVIETVYLQNPQAVFVMWDPVPQHLVEYLPPEANVIKGPGPSAGTAYDGFFKSSPFTQINKLLKEGKQDPIDWKL